MAHVCGPLSGPYVVGPLSGPNVAVAVAHVGRVARKADLKRVAIAVVLAGLVVVADAEAITACAVGIAPASVRVGSARLVVVVRVAPEPPFGGALRRPVSMRWISSGPSPSSCVTAEAARAGGVEAMYASDSFLETFSGIPFSSFDFSSALLSSSHLSSRRLRTTAGSSVSLSTRPGHSSLVYSRRLVALLFALPVFELLLAG